MFEAVPSSLKLATRYASYGVPFQDSRFMGCSWKKLSCWLYFFFLVSLRPDCGVFAGMVESGSEHQRLAPLNHDPMA
jgi:hypothetical protein